jgi:hypothetical protein
MRTQPTEQRGSITLLDRMVIGAVTLLIMLVVGVQMARAAEIIPSIGITKPVDGDEDAEVFGGIAFRGEIASIFKPEIGVAYRQENRLDDNLEVRMWPVTASLWISPVPALYAGAGVGWYHTTYDFDEDAFAVPVEDETSSEFGVHLGGGLMVPLGPRLGVDLNGRYVMFQDQDDRLVPENFDPDFWSTSLGLAFRF